LVNNTGTKNLPKFAVFNGKVVPFSDAKISIIALGLSFSAAVFKGLRAYWNPEEKQLYVFQLAEHTVRLQFSMRVIELDDPPTRKEFRKQVLMGLPIGFRLDVDAAHNLILETTA
jgi:branched-chain amino acid aminotransferase